MELKEIWFYSLSTISQVVAALAALFGVFVVFKLDKINRDIEGFRNMIIKFFISIKNNEDTPGSERKLNKKISRDYHLKNNSLYYSMFSDKKITEMIDKVWKKKSELIADFQFGDEIVGAFRILIERKSNIVSLLKSSLILSAIIIISSVLLLVFPFNIFFATYNFNYYHLIVYTLIPLSLLFACLIFCICRSICLVVKE